MDDICVVGLGAVGVIYACVLSRGARVTAVCRSNYDILSGPGIDIESGTLGKVPGWKPHRVVSSVAEAADRRYAFVVCCFKALPDQATTPALLGALVARADAFVLIQNGVGIERDLWLAASAGPGPAPPIVSCCAWIDTTTVDGGRRVQHNGLERLSIGVYRPERAQPVPPAGEAVLARLDALLRAGGCNAEIAPDVEAVRWQKVLWNASFSVLCTLTRAGMKDLFRAAARETTKAAIRGFMDEVVAVAAAQGLVLPADAAERMVQRSEADFSAPGARDFRPSMLVDLDCRRPMEVEVIVGAVVRAARAGGVRTPRLDLAYAALRIIQGDLLSVPEGAQ